MYFDRFDICAAYRMYAIDYHDGQWSKLYSIIGKIHNMGYKPGLWELLHGYYGLSDNAKEIYQQLVKRKYKG